MALGIRKDLCASVKWNTFAFLAVIYVHVSTSIVFVVMEIYSYSVVKGRHVHVQVRLTNGNKSTLLLTIPCSNLSHL